MTVHIRNFEISFDCKHRGARNVQRTLCIDHPQLTMSSSVAKAERVFLKKLNV